MAGDEPKVGICVSGGGLRAAAFGLGVLQALQHDLKLLRGDDAADYLSAVSGGSYIAGAYTLVNCSDRVRPANARPDEKGVAPDDPDPLAPGSPEAEHLRRHCRYMIEGGGRKTSMRLAGLAFINLVAVVSLPICAGAVLVLFAKLDSMWGITRALDGDGDRWWVPLILGLVLLIVPIAVVFMKRQAWPFHTAAYVAAAIPLVLGMAMTLPLLMDAVLEVPALSDRDWILQHAGTAALAVGCVIAVTLLSVTLSHILGRGAMIFQRLGRFGLNLLTLRLIQLIGLLIVMWSAAWLYRHVELPSTDGGLAPIVHASALLLAITTGLVVDRVSPHHAYRDLLVRCFSVVRTGPDSCERPGDPVRVKLSCLKPKSGETKFPELLICAAANVSDVGASPAGHNALSLVLSPTKVVLPAVSGATVPIEEFEELQRPFGLFKRPGPGITLASAVAMTGAAVSPAMGRMTRHHQRALFAALNLRLGVWLPNPLAPRFHRGEPAPEGAPSGPDPWSDSKIKVRMFEFIGELFGWHPLNHWHLYVSDGGHYDNLGLVELLRRKCRVGRSGVWTPLATSRVGQRRSRRRSSPPAASWVRASASP